MVKRALQIAGAGITHMVESVKRKKVEERHLLIVFTDKDGEIKIIAEKEARENGGRLNIEKGERTTEAVKRILRGAFPWLHGLDLVVTPCNLPDFIDNHIEYDVVRMGIEQIFGIPEETDPETLLEKENFVCVLLKEHPQKDKLIKIVGRP